MIEHLWEYVAADLKGYASAHLLDEKHRHVCLVDPCRWHHAGAAPVKLRRATGRLVEMKPNMHLVVQRYVKPWTQGWGVGLALLLNAGHLSVHRSGTLTDICKADVFISHSWGQDFEEFATTLARSLSPDRVVWVCSFALDQNSDISAALQDLDQCPFSLALKASKRVLVITDPTLEAFSRCWVVLEAHLSRLHNKPYDMTLLDNADMEGWKAVRSKLDALDVTNCEATAESDKRAILNYAEETAGGVSAVNDMVREVARLAVERAEVMAAATAGDVGRLVMDLVELRQWRSIRGCNALHIAAKNSRIAAMVELVNKAGDSLLHSRDADGCSPMSGAVASGQLASVEALVGLRADLNQATREGLTALHIAAARGHAAISACLLGAKADMELDGTLLGQGRKPLHIAAREGHVEIVHQLLQRHADVEARSSTGAAALFYAASAGHAEVAALLLGAQADPDTRVQDDFGRTPLMRAIFVGSATVAGLLLAAMANPLEVDADGLNCFDYNDANPGKDRREKVDPERQRFLSSLLEKSRTAMLATPPPSAPPSASSARQPQRVAFASPARGNHGGSSPMVASKSVPNTSVPAYESE